MIVTFLKLSTSYKLHALLISHGLGGTRVGADQYSIFCIKSRYMVATGIQVTSCVHRFGRS